ncbi:SUL2 [[Candida] subhashii]|uniref:SUL2 n=1 Tax=[Candida] subhashii TaxID=561895 RepID=A0A8J5UJC3_9ASCO|nr:SUL2 [[Candida] subhashii]KAG7664443.1 SUL2 [[Candida] subhashii]
MSDKLDRVKSIATYNGPESQVPDLFHEDLTSKKSHEFPPAEYPNISYQNSYHVHEYKEEEVAVLDWLKKIFANPLQKIFDYLVSLFPIAKWILHYNGKWLYGDLVAGITVGVVLVPQSMSYAQVATLPAQYGLYSSFVGVFIYSFFATSKDVSIGPVAVMSLQVSKVIAAVQADFGDKYGAPEIATFLSLICGGIAAAIGVLRLGFILEFISIPAVMGFMSGSALNIIVGQVPGLMGYNSLVNTRVATYTVVINTLKNLKHTTVDAAFGLVCLFILYLWKYGTEFGQKRYPKYKLWFFYTQQLRNAIVIIVATAISWGVVHPKKVAFTGPAGTFKPPISTIGVVPRGLQNVGVMTVPDGIFKAMASEIPISTIILLLEHIAISKSFGRVNDYKVVPDQEVIAIGVTNLIGTFFNAYPATGSFSRSALKAKCGVRTPVAGLFTGAVVLLALYCLTSAFYYIPKATLSAVIIHAVSDLIANYKVTWSFWKISPLDCGIFVIGLIITIFSSIESGIYFAIAASAAVLLFRIAKPHGQFLGKVQVAEIVNPIIIEASNDDTEDDSTSSDNIEIHQVLSRNPSYKSTDKSKVNVKQSVSQQNLPNIKYHTRWVPLTKENINSGVNVTPPPPGVIVFKPVESFTYPNASKQVDRVSDEAKRLTRRGKPYDLHDVGSRPWNDPGPLRWKLPFGNKNKSTIEDDKQEDDQRPLLRLVHFDFSTVASIDVTSIQALVDLRKALNNYADREVEFHFSGILNPWIRRGLMNAGFGTYEEGLVSEKTFVNVIDDLESSGDYVAAISTDTPFFHLDIPDYRD